MTPLENLERFIKSHTSDPRVPDLCLIFSTDLLHATAMAILTSVTMLHDHPCPRRVSYAHKSPNVIRFCSAKEPLCLNNCKNVLVSNVVKMKTLDFSLYRSLETNSVFAIVQATAVPLAEQELITFG